MNLTVHVLQWNGTGVPPIDLVVDTGGIVINSVPNVSPTVEQAQGVTDFEGADITVNVDGYYGYTMHIDNVYNQDKTIYIMMVPVVTDFLDPNYNRPHPMFFYFQDPCSFTVDAYNASSYGGNIFWYVNNILFADTDTKVKIPFCAPGQYQIKTRGTTYGNVGPESPYIQLWDSQWANFGGEEGGQGETGNVLIGSIQPVEAYLELDTITNVTETEYRPTIVLEASSPVDQLDNACCYTKDETVNIVASVTPTREGATLEEYTITFAVTDPDGLTVLESTTAADEGFISFVLEKLGAYNVDVVVEDSFCGLSYSRSLDIETCNFIVIEYVDCNNYTVSNKSSATDVTYNLTSIDGTILATNVALNAGQTNNLALGDPSLYFLAVSYERLGEDVSETYVINNYCVIEECLSSYMLNILCESTTRCNPCPDDVVLNQFTLLFYNYFMELNREYAFNNFYSGLDQSQLERLGNIKQVMDRILEFCSRNGCNSAFDLNTRSAGWTPYDMASGGIRPCGCNHSGPKSFHHKSGHPGTCKSCNGRL